MAKTFGATHQNNHLYTIFVGFCASKGIDFGQNFVPVRIGVHKFVPMRVGVPWHRPSRGIQFSAD